MKFDRNKFDSAKLERCIKLLSELKTIEYEIVYTAQTAHSARTFCPHSPLLPTVLPIS